MSAYRRSARSLALGLAIVGGLTALALGLATALGRFARRTLPPAPRTRRFDRLRQLLTDPPTADAAGTHPIRTALVFFAATLALLSVFKAWAPIHLDTARDLLIARECVIGTHCPHAGAPSSFGHFVQGALWVRLLELRELGHFSLGVLDRAVDVLLALAGGVVGLILTTSLGRRAGPWAWALWFPATLYTIGYPALTNPAVSPLVLALFYGAVLLAVRSGKTGWWLASGTLLALVVDAHVAHVLLFPAWLFITVAAGRKPTIAVFVGGAAFVITSWIVSPGSLVDNGAEVSRHLAAIPVSLTIAVGGGVAARSRIAALAAAERAWITVVVFCCWVAVALLAARLATGHSIEPRYAAPLATPAAMLLAVLLGTADAPGKPRLVGMIRRLGPTAAGIVATAHVAGWALSWSLDPSLRLHEVEPIAAKLFAEGWSFPDLYRHLRGPHAFKLIATLAALEPPAQRPALAEEGMDVLVFAADRSALPRELPTNWHAVGVGGRRVAIVARYQPYVQTNSIEVCRSPGRAASGSDCVRFDGGIASLNLIGEGTWIWRAYPTMKPVTDLFPNHLVASAELTYRMPLRVPPGSPARQILTLEGDGLAWRIDSATGFDRAALRPTQLPLGGAAQRDGEIVFSVEIPHSNHLEPWLPAFVEVPEGEASEIFRGAAWTDLERWLNARLPQRWRSMGAGERR